MGGRNLAIPLVRALGMGDLLELARQTPGMTAEQIAAQRKVRMAISAFVDEMPVNGAGVFARAGHGSAAA